MEVVIAGSHGLIGSALRSHLAEHGHRVRLLVRGAPNGPDEFRWDPRAGTIDESAVAGADVAVNLAGAGVGDHRWTEQYKREILESRTRTTRTLGHALATVPGAPLTWVQASAIGYYGDRGDEVLTEASPRGQGFLAEVVETWEAETAEAAAAGVRVAHLRSGLVFSRRARAHPAPRGRRGSCRRPAPTRGAAGAGGGAPARTRAVRERHPRLATSPAGSAHGERLRVPSRRRDRGRRVGHGRAGSTGLTRQLPRVQVRSRTTREVADAGSSRSTCPSGPSSR